MQHSPGHITGRRHAAPSLMRRLLGRPSSAAHVVVHLRGDIGGGNTERVGELFDRALRSWPETFEVDLAQVRHLGPDGTVPFFSALKKVRAAGNRMVLSNASVQVAAVLHRVGFDRALGAPPRTDGS